MDHEHMSNTKLINILIDQAKSSNEHLETIVNIKYTKLLKNLCKKLEVI